MIYVGFPCIGKSSIAGGKNIDLESSNMFIEGNRPEGWEKIYCNIAIDLSKQGFNVFVSSHSLVWKELKSRGQHFIAIFPSKHLKEIWTIRAEERYKNFPSNKNLKALNRIKSHFQEDIEELENNCPEHYKLVTGAYNLNDLLKYEGKYVGDYKFNCCAVCPWATSGYCPMGTSIGCVSTNEKVQATIEEFEKQHEGL